MPTEKADVFTLASSGDLDSFFSHSVLLFNKKRVNELLLPLSF